MTRLVILFCAACALMGVTTDARASCTVDYTAIQFPAYDVFSPAPVDAVGAVRYKCAAEQPGVTPRIRIAFGPGPDRTFERRMARSGETLKYNLFLNSQRTVVWGDGTLGTLAYTAACCPTISTATVYGRIFPGQDVAAGSYQDTVVVTLEF